MKEKVTMAFCNRVYHFALRAIMTLARAEAERFHMKRSLKVCSLFKELVKLIYQFAIEVFNALDSPEEILPFLYYHLSFAFLLDQCTTILLLLHYTLFPGTAVNLIRQKAEL